jgi:hypothetical protein
MKRVLLVLWLVFWCLSGALASGGSNAGSRDNWGALAYSKSTGRYGFAYDFASQSQAINSAVERCKARDCQAVVWFVNGCGAFAKSDCRIQGLGRMSQTRRRLSYHSMGLYF